MVGREGNAEKNGENVAAEGVMIVDAEDDSESLSDESEKREQGTRLGTGDEEGSYGSDRSGLTLASRSEELEVVALSRWPSSPSAVTAAELVEVDGSGIWVFGGVMLLAASGIFMVLRSWKFGFKLTTKA